MAQVTYLLVQLFGASAAPALSTFRSIELGVRGRSPIAEPNVGWSLDPSLLVIMLFCRAPVHKWDILYSVDFYRFSRYSGQ